MQFTTEPVVSVVIYATTPNAIINTVQLNFRGRSR